MKSICIALLLALALNSVSARKMQQSSPAPTTAASSPSYDTVAEALTAAANAPMLSTLLAAVSAANLTIPANATWTIFAPTNDAFANKSIEATTGLTAAQLLEPENKEALVQLLSYHVVPAAAVASSALTDGQVLETALEGATLTVKLMDGMVMINDATVVTADIKAGDSIIHVIDKVLIPKSLVKA